MDILYFIIVVLVILLILVSKGFKIDFYYVGLILIFIYVIISEKSDFLDVDNKRLKKNTINGNDSKDNAFLKLLYSSEYTKNMIIWRQCYIIAFISAFLVWIVLTRNLPTGQNLFITTLIIFIVTYCVMNYYVVHLHNEIQERLKNDILYYDKNFNN